MNDERRGSAILGAILVLVGIAFLVVNATDLDIETWPLFIVLPGLVLFGAAFFVGGEGGSGFAIAGSIVTTVGLVLAVQEALDLTRRGPTPGPLSRPARWGSG